MPYANENENLWECIIEIQHPLADIEIIPWDSSLVIFISKFDDMVDAFMKNTIKAWIF